MNRKKILKKTIAIALTAAMAGAAFTGCAKKTQSSGGMFKTLQAATEVEKADIKTKIELESNGEAATLTLEGQKDGSNRMFDIDIDFKGQSFGIDDAIVITDDAFYLNYKNVRDAVCEASGVSGAGDEFDKLLGVSGDWLSLEMKGAFDTEGFYDSETAKQLDETFKKYIDKDSSANIYTITFTENEDLKKFLDTAADYVDDNKDEWAGKIVKKTKKFESQVVDMAGKLIDKLAEKYNENGQAVSDDEIAAVKSEIESGINVGLDKDELSEQIGSLADKLRTYSSDEDVNIEFSVSKDKDSYTQYAGITVGSGSDKTVLKMTTTVTPDKKAEVAVPESDDDLINIAANAVYYVQVMKNSNAPLNGGDDIIETETETDKETEPEKDKETETGETETKTPDASSSDNSYFGKLVSKTKTAMASYMGVDVSSLETDDYDSEYTGKQTEITSYDAPFGWMSVNVNVIEGNQKFDYDDDFLDFYKEDIGYTEYDFQYKDGYSVRIFSTQMTSDSNPIVRASIRDGSGTSELFISASTCSAEGEDYARMAEEAVTYIEEFVKALDY